MPGQYYFTQQHTGLSWRPLWCPDLVLGLLCEAAELSEFQLNACDLSQRAVRRPARGVGRSFADVDVRERNLRGGFEGRHQPGPQVFL